MQSSLVIFLLAASTVTPTEKLHLVITSVYAQWLFIPLKKN